MKKKMMYLVLSAVMVVGLQASDHRDERVMVSEFATDNGSDSIYAPVVVSLTQHPARLSMDALVGESNKNRDFGGPDATAIQNASGEDVQVFPAARRETPSELIRALETEVEELQRLNARLRSELQTTKEWSANYKDQVIRLRGDHADASRKNQEYERNIQKRGFRSSWVALLCGIGTGAATYIHAGPAIRELKILGGDKGNVAIPVAMLACYGTGKGVYRFLNPALPKPEEPADGSSAQPGDKLAKGEKAVKAGSSWRSFFLASAIVGGTGFAGYQWAMSNKRTQNETIAATLAGPVAYVGGAGLYHVLKSKNKTDIASQASVTSCSNSISYGNLNYDPQS